LFKTHRLRQRAVALTFDANWSLKGMVKT